MQSDATTSGSADEPSGASFGARPAGGAATPPLAPSRDERQWAMLCHVSALLAYVSGVLGIVAIFVIWLLKRDEMPFVADQGKEALNFQLTILLALLLTIPLMFVFVGLFVAAALVLYHCVFTVVAAVKATEGVAYRYPYCLRPLK